MPNFRTRLFLLALAPLAFTGGVRADDQRSADQNKCASYGYEPGTDRFADCMMMQDNQRANDQQRTMDSLDRQDRRDRQRMQDTESSTNSNLVDNRPQFDKDGNPNFDAQGNCQGCHGIGCQVNNSDS